MPLAMVQCGERVRVVHVAGSDAVRKHLGSLGVVPGAIVTVCQIASGSMIIGLHDSRLAINEDLLRRIHVEAA